MKGKFRNKQVVGAYFTSETYTINGFFGKSGIVFNTYLKARRCNPKSMIVASFTNRGCASVYDLKFIK